MRSGRDDIRLFGVAWSLESQVVSIIYADLHICCGHSLVCGVTKDSVSQYLCDRHIGKYKILQE